jgi:carbonic anhydrase/acetyltransferase-like protein (isoleucine patch superfamily)
VSFLRLRRAAWEPAIFPLDEAAGAVLVGGLPLAALQDEAARGAGLVPAELDVTAPVALPAGTGAACAPDAVFSTATVRALQRAARAAPAGGIVQAAVAADTPLGRAARRLAPPDARGGLLRLPLWAGALGGLTPTLAADPADAFPAAKPVAVCDEDSALQVRVPPHGRPPHMLEIPRVLALGGRLIHWLHVLELSLAALETRRLELGLVDRRGDGEKNRLGKGVDIHPTATVIGSILDDGVRVEPHASVVGSFVGKDALVADHSVIHTCVIGDRCRTLVDTSLRRVVAMPGSTLSNLGLSDVVIGGDVFLTTAVATFDQRPGEDAVVDGQDTGRAFVGAAIGARCVLGTRALLRAGVALPPGLLVVARPGEAALKLDEPGLRRSNMIRGQRLENV